MALGTSLFLIAVGAILKFAVTAGVSGIRLETVGTILMVVGIIGGLISLLMLAFSSRRDDVVEHRHETREPYTRRL